MGNAKRCSRSAARRPAKAAERVRRHLVIPDAQVKPGVATDHLVAVGRYAAEWKPDVIVQLGDWWDFPSLSSYDEGMAGMEGRRYRDDVETGNNALEAMTREILRPKGYRPRLVMLGGNHDGFTNGGRPDRFLQKNPKLIGQMKFDDLAAKRLGWEYHEFLDPVTIDGIIYCHYFCRSASGGVVKSKNGAPTARAQVQREMRSCTAGHKQGLDVWVQPTQDGIIRGLICGSFYQHEEDYLTPQGRAYWRGVVMKHEVHDGAYDMMEVSLNYLLRKWA